jgi:hypothetical protein
MEGSNATGGGGKVVASATGGLDVAKEGGGGLPLEARTTRVRWRTLGAPDRW